MESKQQEQHDKAWKLLEEKGLSLGERINVRTTFADAFRDDFPFIDVEHNKKEVMYKSKLNQISMMGFETEKEANLANSMVLAMDDKFEINEFMYQFKMVLRLLQIESNWAK